MKRLLESDDLREAGAAALCCHYSDRPEASALLKNHPERIEQIKSKTISWKKLKERL
jgi:hypothetical protein